MVRYKELGFNSFEDYTHTFFHTLLPSNKTYDYFVNWSKVKVAVNKYLGELSLLNSLIRVKENDRISYFQDLLKNHPTIAEVIPLLIAERARKGKIDIFNPELESFIHFEFKRTNVNDTTIPQITEFCIKTGIIDLFNEIKDITDYLLGVSVGLDTHARKNRGGKIFEKMCQQKVAKFIDSRYTIVYNDPNFSLYPIVAEDGRSKGKKHDIVVYKGDVPVLIVECNFYNSSGSKLSSIAESYINMYNAAKEENLEFLWVTDGPAWYKEKQPLLLSMKKIDWILNYSLLSSRRMRKILK